MFTFFWRFLPLGNSGFRLIFVISYLKQFFSLLFLPKLFLLVRHFIIEQVLVADVFHDEKALETIVFFALQRDVIKSKSYKKSCFFLNVKANEYFFLSIE